MMNMCANHDSAAVRAHCTSVLQHHDALCSAASTCSRRPMTSFSTLCCRRCLDACSRRLYAERTDLNNEILNTLDTDDFDGTVAADGSDAARTMVMTVAPSPVLRSPMSAAWF